MLSVIAQRCRVANIRDLFHLPEENDGPQVHILDT